MDRPRVVVVTGCSSPAGIGFATARRLAEGGDTVVATVRHHDQDEALRHGLGDELVVADLDLLDAGSIAAAVAGVVEREGRIDVLVNNAAFGLIGGVEQVTLDQARAEFETNFFGTMALVQAVVPHMRAAGRGHVVNVSTIFCAGLCPPALGYYVATKAALEAACQALAIEVAPFGVAVTNFQPGPVATELSRDYGARRPDGGDPRPALVDELYAWIGQPGAPALESPADVAEALAALVDDPAPPLAAQSGPGARRHVADALVDPGRGAEWATLRRSFPGPA